MGTEVNSHIKELFTAPLKEFTRARKAKVAALNADGHSAEAQLLERLAKPTVLLWAVNQLARLVPKQVSHFIDLVQQARRKQLSDPRAAAEAMQAQRAELTTLTKQAVETMTKAGYRASSVALGRISNTLLAAAVDRDLSEDLRHGCLTAELPAPGFEVLAGISSGAELKVLPGGRASPRASEEAGGQQARERARRERLAQEAEAARRQAMARAEAAERAGQEVRDLERQLAEAQRRFLAARREAAAAAKRVPRPTGR